MSDPLRPEAAVLMKLGSLAVHIDEFLSSDGDRLDLEAINSLLADEELKAWLDKMAGLALIPVKRK